MLLLTVESEFDKVLKETFVTMPDVLKFLLNHERKGLCLQNLQREIHLARAINNDDYRAIVKASAHMFAQAALTSKEQELLSKAEIARREKEHDRIKLAEEMAKDLEKEATTKTLTHFGGIDL